MSNPDEQQPFAQPNPRPGQQPVPPWPAQQPVPPWPAQFQQSPPQPEPLAPQPQRHWQPSPPASKQNNGLAITALVVASLTLLTVLGLTVFVVFTGFFSSAMAPQMDLQGTAPQVAAGQTYPGELLQDEVARVISGDYGDVESMTCPQTPAVGADAVAVCHGVVDGYDTEVTVTFEDDLGHFTLAED